MGSATAALLGGGGYASYRYFVSSKKKVETGKAKTPVRAAKNAAKPVEPPKNAPPRKRIFAEVYGPYSLANRPEKHVAMKETVARLIAEGVVSEPTPEQWEMILSAAPTACVAAGAGSGKSTTLALRVYYMVAHLKLPQNRVTVVTFTRAAVKDLRAKLDEVFVAAGWRDWTDESAETVVRTFHSVVYRMAETTAPGFVFFELLGKDKDKDVGPNGELVENPMSNSKLNDAQRDALRNTYIDLYDNDLVFRTHVHEILRIESLRDETHRPPRRPTSTRALEYAHKRDKHLVQLVSEYWESKGLWPIPGINPQPVKAFNAHEFEYFANGTVEATGQLIFLGKIKLNGKDIINGARNFPDKTHEPISWDRALGLKKNIISVFCDQPSIVINSHGILERLKFALDLEKGVSKMSRPIFEMKLLGDFSYQYIFEEPAWRIWTV
jgi:hypothetical protein